MTPGNHIGQYRIIRKLGAGGMGMVFLGEHILLKRRAAIKTLLPSLSVHEEIVERFFNEARATSAISDPGVVQVFDFGYHVDGTAYIVMELLEGESLAVRMDRIGAMPVQSALRIARQVASSLATAHAEDIVHRDLKPENIYLVRDSEAETGERTKLFDFGICKVDASSSPSITHTDMTLGTPVYMAPEQCKSSGRTDQRSDIYALGCVLFHMLTGHTPFECEGAVELMAAHMYDAPPVASERHASVPTAVDPVIARCLAKAPEDRYQSMAELQGAIELVLAKLSAPGVAGHQGAAARAVLLGGGFKSQYTGNLEDSRLLPPKVATPIPGFTDESSPRLRRAALVMALVLGVVVASIATRFTGADEAIARPAAIAEPVPAQVVQPAPAMPPATAATPAPTRAARTVPAARPPAIRRAPAPAPRPAAPKPPEDLYDTR